MTNEYGKMKTAKIITVDGLNPRFLGAYGNTWVQTPFLDQLASRSIVAEYFIAEAFDKSVLMQRIAEASASRRESNSLQVEPNLFGFQKTTLITDDEVFASNFGNLFKTVEWVQVESEIPDDGQTDNQPETHFERLFSVAALYDSHMDSGNIGDSNASPSELIWIHSSGMSLQWDAPLEMQEHFKGETDPEPRVFSPPPFLTLDEHFDPDQRTEILHGYAAEIRSLDESLERYFKATEPKTASAWPSLTLFCGLRGFPLGEHLHVGIPPDNQRRKDDATNVDDTGPADELYCENLHVPFFLTSNATTTDSSETGETNLKFDRAQFEGDRVDQFLQTSDIAAILRKWLETPENGDLEIPTRELAISTCRNQSRIQTDDWSLILRSEQTSNHPDTQDIEDGIRRRLFAKPDDRLEINEVSGICEEIADNLEASLKKELAARGLAK